MGQWADGLRSKAGIHLNATCQAALGPKDQESGDSSERQTTPEQPPPFLGPIHYQYEPNQGKHPRQGRTDWSGQVPERTPSKPPLMVAPHRKTRVWPLSTLWGRGQRAEHLWLECPAFAKTLFSHNSQAPMMILCAFHNQL